MSRKGEEMGAGEPAGKSFTGKLFGAGDDCMYASFDCRLMTGVDAAAGAPEPEFHGLKLFVGCNRPMELLKLPPAAAADTEADEEGRGGEESEG